MQIKEFILKRKSILYKFFVDQLNTQYNNKLDSSGSMLQTQNGIFIVTPFAMPHNSNKRTTLSCIGERHRSRSINEIESDAHVSSADIALENYCVDVSKEMLVDVLSSGVNMTNEGSRRSA